MDYFMDELQDWEVYDLYNMLQYADTTSWEQTRWLMYVIAQVNSRKQLKVTDILNFSWDQTQKNITITDDDIKRLREKADIIGKKILNT